MSKKSTQTFGEKTSIVLERFKEQNNVSEICCKYGLSQSLYYKWRDKFLKGTKALNGSQMQLLSKTSKAIIEKVEKIILSLFKSKELFT